MNTLRKIQNSFKDFVFQKRNSDLKNAPVNTLSQYIETNGISVEARLKVYRNNTMVSLSECLKGVFPTIEKLVGEEFFKGTARAYLESGPMVHPTLNKLGNTFPDFLKTFEHTKEITYLSDAAQLDWLFNEVFYAEETPSITAESLTQISPEEYSRLQFEIHPAFRLFESPFPIDRIWKLCREDSDNQLDLSKESGCTLLVSLEDDKPFFAAIEPEKYNFLHNLSKGNTLGETCDKVLEIERTFDIQGALVECLKLGTFSKATIKTN
ncbi:MAG: DUF2063 domain-containing protein [Alphaproteobacteria bacterium]|nr:DUF2063 domain-containing protein [Alphaproteobacteria bacterium]MBT5389977.1 DUF2063 domain-containing protein [Alphaproteobacteria bacterium]MBT5541071.1 DUF2063 domain-containing protein [Alphaproteobacteria bacterium]